MPCDEAALQPFPEGLLGEWTMSEEGRAPDDKNNMHLNIALIPNDEKHIGATVEITKVDKRWPPVMTATFAGGDKRFCVAAANMNDLLEKGKYDEESMILWQPVFLIFELTGTPEAPELQLVTFVKKQGDDYVPLNDKVRLKDNSLVLNSTPEIQDMLTRGEYEVSKKFILTRVAK